VGGRIVNLSSFGSVLAPYSKEIQARFRDEKLSLKGLEEIARDYEVCLGLMSFSFHSFDVDEMIWYEKGIG